MEGKDSSLSDIAYMAVDIPSHLVPFLGFLSEMETRGQKLDIYGPKGLLEKVGSKIGQNCFEFEEMVWKMGPGFDALFKSTYESFLKTIPAIEALWNEKNKKPKLIIADMFAPYAKVLAKKHEIPLVVSFSSYFFTDMKEDFVETIQGAFSIGRSDDLLILENEVKDKYQMSISTAKDILIIGDINVSCLSKFVGDLVTLPKENFKYIGPALREEGNSTLLDIDPSFLKDNNLIYVSLGTAPPNMMGFSFYDLIIDALKETEHKVIISAAFGKAEELIAKGLPRNIIVRSWVPQVQVLGYSKLFISHVGAGGLMEALTKGVPILAVPNFADQPVNAEVVETLNVGKWLKDKTPDGIKKAVKDILGDDSIKVSCEENKRLIDTKTSRQSFIEIINSLLK